MPASEPEETPSDSRLSAFVANTRDKAKHEQQRFSALVAKHEHRPLVDVVLRTYSRDREVAGTVVGSAIAFRLFLFFVPLLLFLVGLSGFIARWIAVDDATDAAGVGGTLADQIESAFEQPETTRWVATLLGLIGMATTGRTLSKVMAAASALSWRLPINYKSSLRVVGALIGLVAGVGLVATAVNRVRERFGIGVTGISFLAVFAIYVVAWIAITSLLPRTTRDPGALLPGAVLVAATITGMQAVSQLYLPNKLGRASELYGAIGTTIVTLGWFFILGRAIVLALSLDAVVYERLGSISHFFFSLPVLRLLPRKSAWIRRFFGLEDPPPADPQ